MGDVSSSSVKKFDSAGTLLTEWGSYGSADGQFRSVRGVAVDGSYNVYVVDFNNGVQIFSDTGAFKARWGGAGEGSGYQQFLEPHGAATNSFGTMVYLADSHNNRIVAFEGFGSTPPSNIAPLSTVTASSQTDATGQTAVKAVDGVVDGYPGDHTKEWATNRQGVGAWLNLSWLSPYSVNQVVLYDRPNLDDQITSATLAFSDGSSVAVGPLNNNGTATTITFPAKVITGLRMTVNGVSSATLSAGLSEIQVFGTPASGIQYTLTTSVTPSGGGSLTADPSQAGYLPGAQVVLTAAPNTGYTFSGWSGGASGSSNPLTVTINGNTSITANFAIQPGSLSVTPGTALSATGATGGPFTPPSTTYTLQNSGNSPITWNVSKTQQWVTLSLSGGASLAPGATATVTVSINATAVTLAAGSYSDLVTFTNATNGSGTTTRAVNLTVTTAQSSNIAPLATVTASTQNTSTGQTAVKAVDGVINGYPGDYTREWATTGQKTGAWLNLSWSAPYSVNQVVLYDRPNLNDQITSATLAFSDGSSIVVGPLNNNGTATTYSFPARVITGLRMTVTGVSSSTGGIGLSEIQVFGTPASATQYVLTTNASTPVAGSVTVNPSQPGYPSGAQVVLTAAPSTGYTFSGWSGSASGSANPLTVTMTGNLSIPANFSAGIQPTNIAPLATVTASSQNTTTGQTALKAVDEVIDGYPGDYTKEWATTGQKVGAFLNLSWSTSHSVTQVVLYDRPNLNDQITGATITFSDGSSIVVGPLNNNGTATTYTFAPRVITGLRLTVTGVSGSTGSVGLSEIQVY